MAAEEAEAKPKKPKKSKIVEVEKERSRNMEDQTEAVRRVQAIAEEAGYSRVSLKNDRGDVWEFEYIP